MKHTKLDPVFVRNDQRGTFIEALNQGIWKNVSFGEMRKGAVMGNHYHKKTQVFFFLIEGQAQIDIIDVRTKKTESIILKKHTGIIFQPYHSHAITYTKKSSFVMGKSISFDKTNTDTYEYPVIKPNYSV